MKIKTLVQQGDNVIALTEDGALWERVPVWGWRPVIFGSPDPAPVEQTNGVKDERELLYRKDLRPLIQEILKDNPNQDWNTGFIQKRIFQRGYRFEHKNELIAIANILWDFYQKDKITLISKGETRTDNSYRWKPNA